MPKSLESWPALCNPMDCSPPGSSCPWDSPGKNTGVGCHALLQGIFLTQGSNPRLLYCKQIPYRWANGEAEKNASSCVKISTSQNIQASDSPGDLVKIAQWSPPLELLIEEVLSGAQQVPSITELISRNNELVFPTNSPLPQNPCPSQNLSIGPYLEMGSFQM